MSKFDNVVLHQTQFVFVLHCGFETSTHPFTNNLHRRVSLAGVARDSIALAKKKPAAMLRQSEETDSHAPCCSGLELDLRVRLRPLFP